MLPGQSASGAQGGMDTETNGMSRSTSRHRTCIPCLCRPQGMQPSLPCGPRSCQSRVRRKQTPGRPDMPVAGRRVCPVMRGPANAGRSRRCPAPSVWLCMPPHTRRNGSPKAIPLVPICRACRVCGWVLAGSRTGCAMGLSRLGLFVPCSGVGGGLRSCPGYAEKGGGTLVVSPPCEVWVRRRATLPHPSGCSTIAVPGLSFRVRNGSGRLPWAMAAANPDYPSHGQRLRVFPRGFVWWVGDRIVDATEGMIHVTCRVSPCRPNDACSCHPSWGDRVVLPFDC